MLLYFNIALIGILFAGLASLVLGILFIVLGRKKNKEGGKDKNKFVRGIELTILGSIVLGLLVPVAIRIFIQEMSDGDSFLASSGFLVWFFMPFVLVLEFALLLFFLIIGVNALKAGFERRKEGIYDKWTIAFGFIILAVGFVVVASYTLFLITIFDQSWFTPKNRADGSSSAVANSINYLIARFSR